jgi:hypothetical protein
MRSGAKIMTTLSVSIALVTVLALGPSAYGSGAYVDPTKLKKKQGEQTASNSAGQSNKSKEQLEAEEAAEKLAKKEALKKALLKGK